MRLPCVSLIMFQNVSFLYFSACLLKNALSQSWNRNEHYINHDNIFFIIIIICICILVSQLFNNAFFWNFTYLHLRLMFVSSWVVRMYLGNILSFWDPANWVYQNENLFLFGTLSIKSEDQRVASLLWLGIIIDGINLE